MDRDVTEALAKLYRSVGLAPLEPPADDGPSAAQVVAAARHFHRRLRARLNEALEEVGFSYARFEILELVDADPDPARRIARSTARERSAVGPRAPEMALRPPPRW
jgi:hypothetical protein